MKDNHGGASCTSCMCVSESAIRDTEADNIAKQPQ